MSWDWDSETLGRLGAYLRARGFDADELAPKPIGDGHSNLTYLIDLGGRSAVLRRPPPPPLPKGANDVLREARVMKALEDEDVPVPRVLAVAEAGEVLDVPFYVMEHVPGPILTDTLPPQMQGHGGTMAAEFVGALVRLHAVDWRARGLEGFGRPENFNLRHLSRLEGLMRLNPSPPADMVALAERLKVGAPAESGDAIVHNDYRIGNVIWSPNVPPRLAAILDWELATIGDPLLDLGYLAACWPVPGHEQAPTQELSLAWLAPGVPPLDAVLDLYARTSGRDLSDLPWYAAMAAWKLAVLYDYQFRLGGDAYYTADQAPRFLRQAEAFLAQG